MALYLSFLNKTTHAQQLIQKPSFMANNKITINNPVQTHYTVEGVQSYAPQQLKALKLREDRTMQGKDGTWAPIKTVLLSDQVIQFDEKDPLKRQRQGKQQQKKEKVKEKPRVQSANRQRVKTNARNAVSTNNQVIVKLQKQMAKKNLLQRKLQKMSAKYKQYFKDVDLKQGLRAKKKVQKQANQQQKEQSKHQQQNDQQEQQIQGQQKLSQSIIKSSDNFDKTTYHKSDKTGKTKKANNKVKNREAKNQIQQKQIQQNSDFNQSKNMSLQLGFDLVRQATTYSQRLGSAIHQMFK